ncbi:MAG TPA: hypothetical protein VGW12_16495 [Pyrinomonadaceae bacterium]|nr:hypothetical protein [Pyrinomonadaceae bacterium]
MISASEWERAARRVGAAAFVRKPQDMCRSVEIIARLFDGGEKASEE